MAKVKTAWFCSACGNEFPKWEGRCPACGEWNTLVEEKIQPKSKASSVALSGAPRSRPQRVSEIETVQEARIAMPSQELNRVLRRADLWPARWY